MPRAGRLSNVLKLIVAANCLAGGWVHLPMALADQGATRAEKLAEENGLDRVVSLTCKRTPIQEALADLSQQAKLELTIDGDAFKKEGFTKNMPVTVEIKEAKLSEALRTVLESVVPDKLDYELRDDGKTLFVSTKAALQKPK